MHRNPLPSPAVIVGIDGSRSAVDAALWAVDEAVVRDIPLRLLYAIDPVRACGTGPADAARDLATAEHAVRYAFTAVESTEKPVKIEVEILQAPAVRALVDASKQAVMLCIGATGLQHSSPCRIGPTAAGLATEAHCALALVRGIRRWPTDEGWVVAEIDDSAASDAVLQRAVEEVLLRNAPLRVLTSWQSRFTDIYDDQAVTDGNRLTKAKADRRLAWWKKRYPELDARAVAVHGSTLNYLTAHAASIQLLVVGHERAQGIKKLIGPPGFASLHDTSCSLLICGPQTVL